MKPLSEQTLYEILEVPDDAPLGEIRRAYERARTLYGPGSLATYTLMAPEELALLDRRIEEAGSVLLDPVARAGYDARLASGTPMPRSGRTSDSRPTVTATVPPGFQQIPVERPEEEEPPAVVPPLAAPPQAPELLAGPVEPPAPVAAAPLPPPLPVAPPPPAVAAPVAAPAPAVPEPPRVVPAAAPVAATPPFAAVAERPAPVEAPAPPAPQPPAAAPARPLEKPFFAEGTRWTGEMLRRAREARGLNVVQLAEKTKITRHHIENVEAERFDKLPAPVYLRGIVLSLARELRLDGQKVARSYLEHMAASLHESK